MNRFAGMQVFVSRATIQTVKRSWYERLWSWPWRPLQATKQVVVPAAIPTDQCYKINGALHCGEQFYEQLKAHLNEAPHL